MASKCCTDWDVTYICVFITYVCLLPYYLVAWLVLDSPTAFHQLTDA